MTHPPLSDAFMPFIEQVVKAVTVGDSQVTAIRPNIVTGHAIGTPPTASSKLWDGHRHDPTAITPDHVSAG